MAVLVFGVLIAFFLFPPTHTSSGFADFLLVLIAGLSFGLAGNVVLDSIVSTSMKVEKEKEYQLVSLKSTEGVEGEFFLGTGKIKNTPAYSYYRKTSDGIKKEVITSENVYIKEGIHIKKSNSKRSEGIDPKLVINWKEVNYDHWFYENNIIFPVVSRIEPSRKKYVFYVPKGSVVRKFKLE